MGNSTWNFRLAAVALLSVTGIFGQTLGEITGRVSDSSGAAVAGAMVTITNTSTNAARSTPTTDAGDYSLPSIPPGTYAVKVERQGFKTETSRNVEVQVQQTVRLDFTLQVGQISESIEVVAESAQLQSENMTVGTVIANQGDRRAAAERPAIPEPGGARAQHKRALAAFGTGWFETGRRPCQPVHLRGRPAHHVRFLHTRRSQ
jgi:hypothetical protein